MDRRDFFRVGAAAGATAAASSCGLPLSAVVGSLSLSPGELGEYLTRVDRGMDAIGKGTILPPSRQREALDPGAREKVDSDEALAKQGLRALLFTSAYNDLDERSQQHPEVQRRLERWMPEVDRAVLGMTATIAELSRDQAVEVQRVLRHDPDIGLTIAEQLERPARLLEVPLRRRLQMRSMVTHFAWRMRVQSPSAVAEEYLTKMHRVAGLSGHTEELKRELAARLTEEAFWRCQRLARATWVSTDQPGLASPKPSTSASFALEPEPPDPTEKPGSGLITGGLITLGIGAAVFGIGAGVQFGAGHLAGAFMMTFGGIGVLVGLILLLIGVGRRYAAGR